MGHAEHFLDRLSRLSAPHVELALALYHDSELVRHLLGALPPSDGTSDRVAISLDDPERGPFVILSRAGAFITCLGEGMTPTDVELIERQRLEWSKAKLQVLRERVAAVKAIAAKGRGVNDLFRRLYEARCYLSREELQALAALRPLLRDSMLDTYVHLGADLVSFRERLIRGRRANPYSELERYERMFWSFAHLAVLVAMDDGYRVIGTMVDDERSLTQAYAILPVGFGINALAARALWGVGKIGKSLIPGYAETLRTARGSFEVIHAMLALGAIAIRHSKTAPEIRRVFSRDTTGLDGLGLRPLATFLAEHVESIIADPAEARTAAVAFGRNLVELHTEAAPASRAERLREALASMSDDDAAAVASMTTSNFFEGKKGLTILCGIYGWVTQVEAEQLYLPRRLASALERPWVAEDTELLIRQHMAVRKAEAPRRVEPKPGRNDPCPCGSGVKYKRCCGRTGAEPVG